MENDPRLELRSYACQVWLGEWRLSTLDADGCRFVLRYLLQVFRSRGPEDSFWSFLERFLFAEEYQKSAFDYECHSYTANDLLVFAETLGAEQVRALIAFLSECYAGEGDRFFASTVSRAVQLYTLVPYDGPPAGTA